MKFIFVVLAISCLVVSKLFQSRKRFNYLLHKSLNTDRNDINHVSSLESHVNVEDSHASGHASDNVLYKKTKKFGLKPKKNKDKQKETEKYNSNYDEVNLDPLLKRYKYPKRRFLKQDDRDHPDELKPYTPSSQIATNLFVIDPVLNSLRKNNKYRRQDYAEDTRSSSSSRESKNFKEQYRQMWLQKKYEAMNNTRIIGDQVNMVAARPWGVPCGDPNQHDIPWGNCMMSMECDPEFRIYRGDLFCGRTQYVCCGIQLSTYDTYQGFDLSFSDKSSESADRDKKKKDGKSSKERRKRKKRQEQSKRKKARDHRKKKMKKKIKKIVKEIRKLLSQQYRNGTKQRKKRTQQLKKFIKDLKKQYRQDRQSVKDLHASDLLHIDVALMERLKEIQEVNIGFVKNSSFREVLMKGTMTKSVARMLLEAYPELDQFLETRREKGGNARRAGGGDAHNNDIDLGYDVEYGYLYY